MTEHDFIFWLQGFLEGRNSLTTTEITIINEKIKKVQAPADTFPYLPLFDSTKPFGPVYGSLSSVIVTGDGVTHPLP